MKTVLIACEESQVICKEFRQLGFEAYSNDIKPCTGGRPEWHIQADCRTLLSNYFDLVIFHPVCTRLANSGVRWLKERALFDELNKACDFFNLRHKFNSPHVATENPIPHKYAVQQIGQYDQIIQPYGYGHLERKATCLWLKNLPKLIETNNVFEEMKRLPIKESQKVFYMPPSPERAALRSKTFSGIASAMAWQWSKVI